MKSFVYRELRRVKRAIEYAVKNFKSSKLSPQIKRGREILQDFPSLFE